MKPSFKKYILNPEQLTFELFSAMCKEHDMSYMYSDDGRIYHKGREESDIISRAAKQLGLEIARDLWNLEVDKKVLPPYNEEFHWRVLG